MRRSLNLALTALLFTLPLAGRTAGTKASDVVVLETDLVTDVPHLIDGNGIEHDAFISDPNLANPWGITASPTSPFWVADNAAGVSTLYRVPGNGGAAVSINPLVVSIPSPGDPLGRSGAPTGTVFNTDTANKGFKVAGVDRNNVATSAPALFIFATEDGTIVGWNPGVNPPGFDPILAGTYGIIAVDNSTKPTVAEGAVYKGLAIATDAGGSTFLYATNFRAGTVEIYDSSFKFVSAFTDPHLPNGYAPFNVVLIGGKLFVTYAKQDAAKHDDVALPAHGLVDIFDLSGHLLTRFTQHGHLNSPWGVVQAPASFGDSAGAILIGNFGDGRIHAFDPDTGKSLGSVVNSLGQEIIIDGLWSLTVGNGRGGGDAGTIYFTAGPNGEKNGLLGSLTSVPLGTPCGSPCQ
jgi:uncharacterized protein (TIGR03118 family)